MKKKISAVLLSALISTAPAASAEDKKFLSIATGGTAGIYFPLGGALGKLWSDNIPGVQATAEVTGASVENVRLVTTNEAQAALGTGNVVYDAYNGTGRFAKPGKQKILAISAVYPNAIQIVTLAGLGIKTLPDMVGKRLSIGAPGSGTEVMNKDMFNAVGITYEQFSKTARLSYAETVNAMKDGTLDVGSLSVGLGAGALLDLASSRDMEMVCMSPEEQKKVTDKFPYYSAFTIPKGTYQGVDYDCPTIQAANHLFVAADADTDLVYQMTKVMYSNVKKLVQTKAAASTVSPEYAMNSTVIPLHPGAIKYFEEVGVTVPTHLKP